MRNLQLLDSLHHDAGEHLKDVQHLAIDYDTGYVYLATNTGIQVLDPETFQFVHQVSLVEESYLSSDGSGKVVGLQHLADQMSACIATTKGDVVLWNTSTSQLECVGTVDSGLRAMAWSPDQELVVLATGQDTLILMTREFDPITEVNMQPEDFGEAKFITVGWGKKETQFHGSQGKEAAVKKQEDAKPAFLWDDHSVRISWQGDGEYFAVSLINLRSGARQLRIWSREMVLHSTSEKVDGLEQALAWKPSGRLIASTQRRPNKHDIVFFEKNGLRHGEFTLPFGVKEVKVQELQWNSDSSILMVWCKEMPPDDNTDKNTFLAKTYVQLWTVSNYHWYLKQSLPFSGLLSEQVAVVQWDPERAYRLHIVCAGGQYFQYTFTWTTHHSQGQTAADPAAVAVIDGDKVLVTPFRTMVVPPPLYAYHLQLTKQVNQVAFAPTPHSQNMAVLLSDGSVAIYEYSQGSTRSCETVKVGAAGGPHFTVQCELPTQLGIFKIDAESGLGCWPQQMCHMTWVKREMLVVCGGNRSRSESTLYSLQLVTAEKCCRVMHTASVPGTVIVTGLCVNSANVVAQLSDGTLLTYDLDAGTLAPFTNQDGHQVRFPQPCSQMVVCQLGGQEVVLGLTDRFRFYVNDVEVANNCTSFVLHDEFLLVSTHAHTCRCISRNTELKELPTLSDGKAHPFDESVRRVERGSRIVHVVPDDTKVILQMPRGNLETIHPRALVLSTVRKMLDRLDFKSAFSLMRKHRINMNLIHDHNPNMFLSNVDSVVQQLETVTNLNLFITNLQEEDVSASMYMEAYNRMTEQPARGPTKSPAGQSTSKINTVCDTLREALLRADADRYLLCILTTYVKKTNPELDVALGRIKALNETGGKEERSCTAEEALTYLIFLVDVNELYDHALGTYDFYLVLMVAEKSQKDPKEYLPFLNNLRKMEPNYQRYSIDLHLKRYSSALTHIAKCTDYFPECLSLVKNHKLYAEGLRLFPTSSQQYKDIAIAYGDFLNEKCLPEEAGLMFCKAEEWSLALAVFQQSLNWRQSMVTAHRLQYSSDKLAQLATDLARRLTDAWRFTEAACLLEQYAGDVELAIVTLINGGVWEEALRLMYKYDRTDFIETHFKDALVNSYETHKASIETMQSDFQRHQDRLAVVRQEKDRARLELLEGGGGYNQADADLFSDTSSATGESVQSSRYTSTESMRSSSSRRSGKSRRKSERKQWSLKEGGRHEDLALIEALSMLCKQTENSKDEIQNLLRMLVLFHEEAKACVLQAMLNTFLSVIESSIPEIWNMENEAMSTATTPALGPEATTNSIIAAMQQGRQPRSEVKLDPSLRIPPPMNREKKWQLHSTGQPMQ